MNKNVNTAANAKKKKKKASGPRFNVFDFLIIVTILVVERVTWITQAWPI